MQSMTGFGKAELENDSYVVSCEIKSVNHRFKDVRMKMSGLFNDIELGLRRELENTFKRGSFDVYINYKHNKQAAGREVNFDVQKIHSFIKSMKGIAESSGVELLFHSSDFLKSEFLKDQDDDQIEELKRMVKQSFHKSLEALKESRIQEGKNLFASIKEHIDDYSEIFEKIGPLTDRYKAGVEEKLRKKVSEFESEIRIDDQRLLQEVVFYLEKLDVHEEMNRIKSHLKKLDELFNTPEEEVGRKLDFLLQELGRETNTIGSKSADVDISDSVVKMKVFLEKVREQALNIQ